MKTRLLLLLLAVVLTLTGCGSDSDDQLSTDPTPSGDHITYNHHHDGEGYREDVLLYHGHALYCLSQYVDHGRAMSCDFVRYHKENDRP